MMDFFMISYLLLWIIVAYLSHLLIQVQRKLNLQAQQAQGPPGPSHPLLQENHGVPSGEIFPKLDFISVNKGNISLNKPSRKNVIVAFTSLGCDKCKFLYPLLEQRYRQNQEIEFVIFCEGPSEAVQNHAQLLQLSVPVIQIHLDDMKTYETNYFPFVYYLTSEAEVILKSIVLFEEQLDLLIKKGNERQHLLQKTG